MLLYCRSLSNHHLYQIHKTINNTAIKSNTSYPVQCHNRRSAFNASVVAASGKWQHNSLEADNIMTRTKVKIERLALGQTTTASKEGHTQKTDSNQ